MALNLIKNNQIREKRVIPRFPLKTMGWKCKELGEHSLEVKDISYQGMQIRSLVSVKKIKIGQELVGTLSWSGGHLETKGIVRWIKEDHFGPRFGIEFDKSNGLAQEVRDFLDVSFIGKKMKSIVGENFEMEIPANLKYWLKSDGPGEIFFWQHRDGELSRIQLIILDKLIEWIDGKGVRTGSIVENEEIDTPLTFEEEIYFDMDAELDLESVTQAKELIEQLPKEIIPENIIKFLHLKLGH